MTEILQLSNVTLSFGGHRVLDEVNFSVEAGSITGLIGPNGAGKTSIFNLICGIVAKQSGDIHYAGHSISGLKPFEVARLSIGRTFQDPRVFPNMSVIDNVMVGIRQRGEHIFPALLRDKAMRENARDIRKRAENLLESVGLHARLYDLADTLSFGEQRFLSIARTLIAEPRLILMDEPTVGLDHNSLGKLTDLMSQIVSAGNTTLLVIEHNMEVVMSISSKIVLLVAGRVEASDVPAEVKKHENMVNAYLGRKHVA